MQVTQFACVFPSDPAHVPLWDWVLTSYPVRYGAAVLSTAHLLSRLYFVVHGSADLFIRDAAGTINTATTIGPGLSTYRAWPRWTGTWHSISINTLLNWDFGSGIGSDTGEWIHSWYLEMDDSVNAIEFYRVRGQQSMFHHCAYGYAYHFWTSLLVHAP